MNNFIQDLTTTKLEEIAKYSDSIYALSKKYHVTNPRVFGSVITGQQHSNSDVDFLMEVTDDNTLFDIGGLQQGLVELLNVPVDVVTADDLNVAFRADMLEMAQLI